VIIVCTGFPRWIAKARRGQAALELALLAPWLFFLFAGTLDFGFYWYALISVQNAARIAVEYTSTNSTTAGNSAGACVQALPELHTISNVGELATCTALPVIVTASAVTGPDGAPASLVSVTLRTQQLIPIPGVTGRVTIVRTAQMRLKSSP
jgi:Flp pilus assembly protein TadG